MKASLILKASSFLRFTVINSTTPSRFIAHLWLIETDCKDGMASGPLTVHLTQMLSIHEISPEKIMKGREKMGWQEG